MLSLAIAVPALAATIPFDASAVLNGSTSVAQQGDLAIVWWKDETNRDWKACFNLESKKPLIASISTGGKSIIQNAAPIYSSQTGRVATGDRFCGSGC